MSNDEQSISFHLKSPPEFSHQFDVRITKSNQSNTGWDFTVKLVDGLERPELSYVLADNSHDTYLNFFNTIAERLQLRTPRNRGILPDTDFSIQYKEVLTTNIAPGILYGYGDPAVIRVNTQAEPSYYLVVTSNDAPDSFPLLRSADLKSWELVNFVFPSGSKPAWAADGEFVSDYWAPEVHQVGNEFRMYYVARDKDSHELCIGVAKAPTPEGPFVDTGTPILRDDVIDPHIFVENEDEVYLYWKKDNNAIWPGKLLHLLRDHPELVRTLFTTDEDRATASFTVTLLPWVETLEPMEQFLITQIFIEAVIEEYATFKTRMLQLMNGTDENHGSRFRQVLEYMSTPVYAARVSSDGRTLVGEKCKVIENDLEWEAHLVEGMWVSKLNGKYFLFYAGNDFSTDKYGIGVAVADSPIGPFLKKSNPILKSTDDWWAPGHPSVALDLDNQPTLFFHAFFPGTAGYKKFRALLSLKITVEGSEVSFE
jgi:arabinan endo-1,5-alpha-L-arabinosidase